MTVEPCSLPQPFTQLGSVWYQKDWRYCSTVCPSPEPNPAVNSCSGLPRESMYVFRSAFFAFFGHLTKCVKSCSSTGILTFNSQPVDVACISLYGVCRQPPRTIPPTTRISPTTSWMKPDISHSLRAAAASASCTTEHERARRQQPAMEMEWKLREMAWIALLKTESSL
ncbi:hypothetical protein C8F01DRAFT_1098508 [Mycena amicta]|nr:hypothetical protein C8F01DRAFT_1098508 [Mycena amicta]